MNGMKKNISKIIDKIEYVYLNSWLKSLKKILN